MAKWPNPRDPTILRERFEQKHSYVPFSTGASNKSAFINHFNSIFAAKVACFDVSVISMPKNRSKTQRLAIPALDNSTHTRHAGAATGPRTAATEPHAGGAQGHAGRGGPYGRNQELAGPRWTHVRVRKGRPQQPTRAHTHVPAPSRARRAQPTPVRSASRWAQSPS